MIQTLYRLLGVGQLLIAVSTLPSLALLTASAETLRVTTWNLQGATSLPPNPILTNALEAAVASLKQLDPDVILLQQDIRIQLFEGCNGSFQGIRQYRIRGETGGPLQIPGRDPKSFGRSRQ